MCSSTILSAYVPVYIYSYTFLCIFPLLYAALLLHLPSYHTLPLPKLFGIPGILWPHDWPSDLSRETNGVSGRQEGESQEEREEQQKTMVSKQLFSTNRRLTNISKHLAVLLTFGLCCPILAFVIALSTLISVVEWRLLLSRFIILRVQSKHLFPDTGEGLSLSADSAIDSVLEPAPVLMPHLLSMVSLPLCASSLFFAFFAWDVAGDAVGWERAYWAPVTAVSMLLLLLGYVYWCDTRAAHSEASHGKGREENDPSPRESSGESKSSFSEEEQLQVRTSANPMRTAGSSLEISAI
jgi:hypothetical protein